MITTYSFPGQQADEKVLLVLHRHWAPFLKDVVRIFILAVIPALLLWGGLTLSETRPDTSSLGYAAMIIGMALFYLFLAILLYGFWLDYYLDVFVVTNKRVVDIEQRGLLSRTISEQPLYRIQDVTSEINGAMAHLFRYGNVYIQSAGQKERFFFEQVPNPEIAVRTILSLTEAEVRAHHDHPLNPEHNNKI